MYCLNNPKLNNYAQSHKYNQRNSYRRFTLVFSAMSTNLQPVSTNALQWEGVRGIFYILMFGSFVGLVSSAFELMYASNKEAEEEQVPMRTA